MDISIFLAKLLGLYLLITGIAMFLNVKAFKTMINEVSDNATFLYLSGALSLIIGLLIVLTHNLWIPDWRILITLIGWLSVIKGIIRVVFPKNAAKMIKNFAKNKSAYTVACVIVTLLGVILTYIGFTVIAIAL